MAKEKHLNSSKPIGPIERPPVHFGPRQKSVSPEDALLLAEGQQLPANIYRTEESSSTIEKEEENH